MVVAYVATVVTFAEGDPSDCAPLPREAWVSAELARASAAKLGVAVDRVGERRDCYRLSGVDANGARIELVVEPLTGRVVGQHATGAS
jgi:hypothetical protein